ncbi:DUF4254 domain-containing protein [Tunturiibacter lichenicola]|uniref:DUF4254 domain-containing protein n=1 Tax=Tunturiibacter lichenicola TaxID=2051959 RepID=UPI003D9AEC3E
MRFNRLLGGHTEEASTLEVARPKLPVEDSEFLMEGPMLDALLITRMQDEMTAALHEVEDEVAIEATADGLMALATAQHRANFDLWHEEDKARVPEVPDSEIVRVKRAIDSLNQRRNDLVEKMDLWLIDRLDQDTAAPLHSETPGLMIDRLSILALKIYHTREESHRVNATEQHRWKNAERLVLLEEQRQDLASCLDALWTEVLEGRRRFKLYRQLKMYNDPELNPAVYGRKTDGGDG